MTRIPVLRVSVVREGNIKVDSLVVRCSEDSAKILQTYMSDKDRECFVSLFLNCRHGLIGFNVAHIGDSNECIVSVKEVARAAILSNAVCVIFAHNHPSGNPEPSQEDRLMHKKLAEAFNLIGIKVLDNIITGDNNYYSFADNGLIG